MKYRIVLILTLLTPLLNFAQTEITVGSDSIESIFGPIYIYSNADSTVNSWFLSIYDPSELIAAGGYPGTITMLSWDKADSAGYTNGDATFEIYIKNTSYTEFTIPITFPDEVDGATLVYSSNTQSLPLITGWIGYTLNTPFYWNGIDNIMIMTRWSRIGLGTGLVKWKGSQVNTRRVSHAADEANSPTSYNVVTVRPNIKIQLSPQPTNDAGIVSLDSVRGRCAGNIGVFATIKNFGNAVLASAQINWEIDGILQSPAVFSGNLASLSTSHVFLGNTTLSSGSPQSIKAWTSVPNGSSDPENSNDSSSVIDLEPGLSGTYLIAQTGANFSSFAEAVSALENNGVCGPTEILFDSGTYAEKIILHKIPNASLSNEIIFRSSSNDSAAVIIECPSSTSPDSNFTLRLQGSEYVTFRSLTFTRNDTNAYSTVIEMTGAPRHIKFLNNRVWGPPNKTADQNGYKSGILNRGNVFWNDVVIRNNYFKDNSGGIWFNGTDSLRPDSIIVEDNVFQNYYSGLSFNYVNSPIINRNIISRNEIIVSNTYYGIYLKNTIGGFQIQKNRITTNKGSNGIRILIHDTTFSTRPIIANNFVQVGATWSGGGFGISIESQARDLDIFHNSINHNGSGSTRCMYVDLTSNHSRDIRILNNVFSNPGGGYSIYVTTPSIIRITASDNNCFYSPGANLAYYGSPLATLTDIQSATGKDGSSVSANPNFVSSNDLHTVASALSNTGSSIPALPDDIDGETRNLSNPDIGADEFSNVGISSRNNIRTFNVYPNPVHDILKIEGSNLSTSIVEIKLFDITGRQVHIQSVNGNNESIDVSGLTSGYYLLIISSSDQIQVENIFKY